MASRPSVATLDYLLKSKFRHGGLEITYPSGKTVIYGDTNPELAIRLKSARPIIQLLRDPSLAIGEGYTSGKLDFEDPRHPQATPPIDLLIKFMADNGFFDLDKHVGHWLDRFRPYAQPNRLRFHRRQVGSHYDIGNEFYSLWLDKTHTYSCAYWDADPRKMTLEDAQQHKIELIERKLRLHNRHELRVLDIGSGWGHLLVDMAKKYKKLQGLGITLSSEQLKASRGLAKKEGVADRVQFKLIDLAELAQIHKYNEYFDRVCSVGMYEHMGKKGQNGYFTAVNNLLKRGGVTLLHAITQQRNKPPTAWTKKYIFPGGHLHPVSSMIAVAERYGFRDIHIENLREHYALTLDEWCRRFEIHLPQIRALYKAGKISHPLIKKRTIRGAEEFIRMWRFYLATASGSFRYGNLGLVQIEATKGIDPTAPLTRKKIYNP